MEIAKILTLSTGHLPQKEFESLSFAPDKVITLDHEYGIVVKIIPDGEDNNVENYDWANFKFLKKIVEYCIANDIKFIDFDQDGNIEPEFESFDW